MIFLYPEALWLLLSLPLLGAVVLFGTIRARRTVAMMVGSYRRADVLAVLTIKSFIVTILQTAAFGLLILAVAGPRWGEVSVEDERRGLDLVLLVDVSNSMLVEDVLPSRLGRSREVIRAVLSRFSDTHASLVAFKGAATVIVPMTDDPIALDLAVANLSPALLTTAGTDLNAALQMAMQAFPSGSPRHRIVLMFSDGGHEEGVSGTTASMLRQSDVPVWTVTAGTGPGGTIPVSQGGVMRTAEGDPVVVRARPERMAAIAEYSGGRNYDLSESTMVQRLMGDLEQATGRASMILFRQVTQDRYHLFVLIAFAMMVLSVLIQTIRWRGVI